MPLYELTDNEFRPIGQRSFSEMNIRERDDLQRLLRSQIDVLGEDLYVIAEEFGDWEDCRRRIDILAIDVEANLVIVELKRTEDGGHMDLQAVRYAAMVANFTFERVEKIHAGFLQQKGSPAADARTKILSFLKWDEPDDELFGTNVRIILASEDFGKELTTAVLWLNDQGLDIQCIRMKPYLDDSRRLVDIQRIIPLPESEDYIVQAREKEQVGRRHRTAKNETLVRFWEGLLVLCRERNTRHANVKAKNYQWLGAGTGTSGLPLNYVVVQNQSFVEMPIRRGDARLNKLLFDQLFAQKKEIEEAFGGPLSWERLDNRMSCRIKYTIDIGGYASPESDWPVIHEAMINAMMRLESALVPKLDSLNLKPDFALGS